MTHQDITVIIKNTTKPFEVYSTQIISHMHKYTWSLTTEMYQIVFELNKVIQRIPERLQVAMEIEKYNEPEAPSGNSLIKTIQIQINNELNKHIPIKITKSKIQNKEQRIFEVPNVCEPIFTQNDVPQETYITFTGSVLVILNCLSDLQTSLQNKDFELYQKQSKVLLKILNIFRTFCTIYLNFIYEILILIKENQSFRGFGLYKRHNKLKQILSIQKPFGDSDIQEQLENNLQMIQLHSKDED